MRADLRPAIVRATLLSIVSLLAACSSAPTSGHATGTVGASANAGSAGVAGTVHMTLYTDNDGPDASVILTGSVGDFGTAESVNPDGSVDPGHRHQLNLKLSHGTFRIKVADLDTKFAAVMAGLPVNTATCSATASVSDAVPVVPGSGTGAYAGIDGTFTLSMTLDEVYSPTHCDETGAFLAQSIVITGSGNVTLR